MGEEAHVGAILASAKRKALFAITSYGVPRLVEKVGASRLISSFATLGLWLLLRKHYCRYVQSGVDIPFGDQRISRWLPRPSTVH